MRSRGETTCYQRSERGRSGVNVKRHLATIHLAGTTGRAPEDFERPVQATCLLRPRPRCSSNIGREHVRVKSPHCRRRVISRYCTCPYRTHATTTYIDDLHAKPTVKVRCCPPEHSSGRPSGHSSACTCIYADSGTDCSRRPALLAFSASPSASASREPTYSRNPPRAERVKSSSCVLSTARTLSSFFIFILPFLLPPPS
jgi:hypothetical protein